MNRYKSMLHGENFLMDLGDGIAKHGFYTHRYTNAESEAHADQAFIDEFRASAKADDLRKNMKNTADDPPRVSIEDLSKCPQDEDFDDGVIPGLAFYSEDDAQEESK